MNGNRINLSSLIKKEAPKIREKDEYILSKTNITREKLQEINDEKYNKILELIENTLKKGNLTSTTEKKENKKLQIEENEKGELFTNYKSDFKKEEKTIFQKIKEKKDKIKEKLRAPKTRISLIVSLLILPIIIISTLFIFFPKYHSVNIYKANILEIKNKYFNKKEEKNNYQNFKKTTFSQKDKIIEINKKINTLTGIELEIYKQNIIKNVLENKYDNKKISK